MCEDKVGCRFRAKTLKVDAIPGRNGGCENAGFWTERRRCVIAQAESVTIVWSARVLYNRSQY